MPNNQLTVLVTRFVADLERLIREDMTSSIQETLRNALGRVGSSAAPAPRAAAAPAKRRPGRPKKAAPVAAAPKKPAAKQPAAKKAPASRSTLADLDATVGRIASYVASHDGARSEVVRAALKIEKNEWIRGLRRALETNRITKKGAKRTTTLHPVGGGASSARAAAPAAAPKAAERASGGAVPPIKRAAAKG